MVNKRRRSSLRWRGRSSAERRWTCSTSLSLALAPSSAIEAACAAGLAGEVGAVLRRLQAESESASVLVVASRSSATAALSDHAPGRQCHWPYPASTRPPGAARQLALGRGVGPRSQHQRARGGMGAPPVPGGASGAGGAPARAVLCRLGQSHGEPRPKAASHAHTTKTPSGCWARPGLPGPISGSTRAQAAE